MKGIGKYHVVAPLSLSDFSDIYAGFDPDLTMPVAVKVFHLKGAQQGADPGPWRQRFIAEARLLARIDHPHIVRVQDFGRLEDGEPYFVMPFQKAILVYEIGHDHPETRKGRRGPRKRSTRALPLRRAVSIWRQLLSALDRLHRIGVIHRDVKPGNLLLTERRNGRVKLCDLGMAKIPDSTVEDHRGTIGTFDYVSPEQAESPKSTDARADVYSCGVLLFRMLARCLPALAEGTLRDLAPNVPRALVDLATDCMAKSAGDRPADASVVLQRLEEIGSHRRITKAPPRIHVEARARKVQETDRE